MKPKKKRVSQEVVKEKNPLAKPQKVKVMTQPGIRTRAHLEVLRDR